MNSHDTDWDLVIDQIAKKLGPRFEPARRAATVDFLAKALPKYLPGCEEDVLLHALEKAYKQFRSPVDWHRFICTLLYLLPGHWVKLANNPGFDASTMLLLTDGTVMCQEQGGLRWKKLTPDAQGGYIHGTWSDLAPMHHTRRYYASAVLQDGRVFVSGGEYSDAGGWTNKTEIYDPVSDTWTEIAPPTGWAGVGDAPCAVLPDGRVLLGSYNTTKTAIYDPTTNSWTAGPNKGSSSSEESWVLLPDDTVITVRCDASRKADKYVGASSSWVNGGKLPLSVIQGASSEIGAGVLLNDGRAVFAGANRNTPPLT